MIDTPFQLRHDVLSHQPCIQVGHLDFLHIHVDALTTGQFFQILPQDLDILALAPNDNTRARAVRMITETWFGGKRSISTRETLDCPSLERMRISFSTSCRICQSSFSSPA
jgi:hypothetical protein